MSARQIASEKTEQRNPIRPVLLVSEETIDEYSLFLEHLLTGLIDESVPVVLVCPPSCEVDSIASPGVEVIRHPVFELPLMGSQNRKILVERLGKFEPTVLHCLCRSQAKLAKQLAKELDLLYVLMINSLQKRFAQLSLPLERLAKIIVPAESIGVSVAEVYPRFAGRIEQINIGTFVPQTPRCFSEPYQLTSIVAAHQLDNVDEFENLFRAVRHLAIDGYEFTLVLISGGRAESQVRQLLGSLGLSRTVIIVPRLRPWQPILTAGDIFVQPWPGAAFNPFLLEAMSLGMAVAGCKGGVDDLLIENETAVVFEPEDELSIYSSLQQLLDRRELAQRLARGAQKHLRENYSVSKMISSTLQTYRDAQDLLNSE